MKKLVLFCALGMQTIICAQSYDIFKISMHQAMELAVKNRYDAQSSNLDILLASNTADKTINVWLPTISTSGSIRYNTQLQENVLPAGFSGNSGEQRVVFGTKNSSSFSLDLEQIIFKPGLQKDIRIAKNNILLAKEKYRQKQSTIKNETAEAYLNVLLKELQCTIAREDEKRYQEYLTLAEAIYKLNQLVESDFLIAGLNYENAKTENLNVKQSYELCLQNLKYKINIPQESILELTDSLNATFFLEAESSIPAGSDNGSEITQLTILQQNNGLLLDKTSQELLPSISFTANYTALYQSNHFDYLGAGWGPFNYISLKLDIPLSEWFKSRNTVRDYQYKAQQYVLDIKQKISDISYKIGKTKTELGQAQKVMQSTQKTFELSKQVYALQKIEYNLGTRLYSSILDKENSISAAEQNYISAVYNYLTAILNYELAIGNL